MLAVSLLFLDSIQPLLGANAFSNIGYGILHASTMYVIGYYLKHYPPNVKRIWWLAVYAVSIGMIAAITLISMKITGDRNRTIADYNSPIVILQSIAFFMMLIDTRLPRLRYSRVAPYIFGVYLLNDNPYAREFLWQKVCHCADFYGSTYMLLHLIMTCTCFLIVAMGIEFIRVRSFEWIGKLIRR